MEGDVFQVSEDLKEKDLNLQSDESTFASMT